MILRTCKFSFYIHYVLTRLLKYKPAGSSVGILNIPTLTPFTIFKTMAMLFCSQPSPTEDHSQKTGRAFDSSMYPSSPSVYHFSQAELNYVLYGYIQTSCNGMLLKHAISDVKLGKSQKHIKVSKHLFYNCNKIKSEVVLAVFDAIFSR